MKNYETQLLSHLQSSELREENVPLANVKKSIGKLAYVKGNPLTKTEITLNIEVITFNVGGGGLQYPGQVPIYLFGLTDYYSSYVKSSLINPLNNLYLWNNVFGIVGKEVNIDTVNGAFPGLAYNKGDFAMFLSDDPLPAHAAMNFFMAVRISCQNVAYGTFLNSFVSDLITIDRLRLIVPIANINQYINPLTFGYQTLFGKTFTDDIDPRMYITSTDFQQQICDIPVNLPIDKSVFLTFKFNPGVNLALTTMSMILFVSKIEPLTHK